MDDPEDDGKGAKSLSHKSSCFRSTQSCVGIWWVGALQRLCWDMVGRSITKVVS